MNITLNPPPLAARPLHQRVSSTKNPNRLQSFGKDGKPLVSSIKTPVISVVDASFSDFSLFATKLSSTKESFSNSSSGAGNTNG